jgi:hypothetical protein
VESKYTITNILPAKEELLSNDIFLVVLYAARVPPHLAVSINGQLFTLSVKGPTVDGELSSLIRLIRKQNIETVFIKLSVPALFTMDELMKEIKKHTLSYPRVDIGLATCLAPIRDFCGSVYEPEMKHVNFVYELLPLLYAKNIISSCYQINLDRLMLGDTFEMNKYSMNDIYEGIRNIRLEQAL